ncbi:hypothetical protein A6U87_25775 [Rhizobium sp. AC44/96]|nr:hypothetical protein A6U87_25775 [Rhizobium sp. AC44/96]
MASRSVLCDTKPPLFDKRQIRTKELRITRAHFVEIEGVKQALIDLDGQPTSQGFFFGLIGCLDKVDEDATLGLLSLRSFASDVQRENQTREFAFDQVQPSIRFPSLPLLSRPGHA